MSEQRTAAERAADIVEGMSDRERLIRFGFAFDSDRDCDAAKYLLGVIDTIRFDRSRLRSEVAAIESERSRARADMERLTNLRNQFVELLCEDRAADPPDELLIARLKTLHDDVNSAPTFADVAELVEALRWRPVETAPKDGTEITGGWSSKGLSHYATGTPIVWQNGTRRQGWFALSPTYEDDNGKFFPGKWLGEREYPTHWRPIPERIDATIAKCSDAAKAGERKI